MVPQYRPENVLILGYGEGTVAELVHMLYGDIPITGVDIDPYPNSIRADAREFVKNSGRYDAVVIDLFKDGKMCDFVCTKEFAEDVKKISNYIIINTIHAPDMYAWESLKYVGVNKPNKCSNLIFYYRTKDIPDLLP